MFDLRKHEEDEDEEQDDQDECDPASPLVPAAVLVTVVASAVGTGLTSSRSGISTLYDFADGLKKCWCHLDCCCDVFDEDPRCIATKWWSAQSSVV